LIADKLTALVADSPLVDVAQASYSQRLFVDCNLSVRNTINLDLIVDRPLNDCATISRQIDLN
jgi:hypothetical protein